MPEPKKITASRKKTFPRTTFNALVEGELRDRAARARSDNESPPPPVIPNSSTFCQLAWDSDDPLDPGSVVVLTEPMVAFEDKPSAPFSGLKFQCAAPTTESLGSPIAITCVQIAELPGDKMAMGVGYVAGACWAQVTINSEDDETAELVDGETFLSSTAAGRVPITWKPPGTGLKWCVVQLSSPGGSSGPGVSIKIVLIEDDIPGITENDPAVTLEEEDIELGEGEEEWDVIFQDPPDDDYDENHVAELDLLAYRRQRLTVKVYESGEDETGTAAGDGGDTDTIELAASASDEDDFYVGDAITTEGQTGECIAYDGLTKVATMAAAWSPAIDGDQPYTITSTKNLQLAVETINDAPNTRKIVRHARMNVWYDDGKQHLVGNHERWEYPEIDENDPDPEGGFPKKRYRGIVINGVLVTILCKPLPPPPLD